MELGPWVKVTLRPGHWRAEALVLQPVRVEDRLEKGLRRLKPDGVGTFDSKGGPCTWDYNGCPRLWGAVSLCTVTPTHPITHTQRPTCTGTHTQMLQTQIHLPCAHTQTLTKALFPTHTHTGMF